MTLTEQKIKALPITATTYLVRDDKVPSLVVRVYPSGNVVYQVRVRLADKIKTRTLAPAGSVSLKMARLQASQQVQAWLTMNMHSSYCPTLATFMANEWREHTFLRWKCSTRRTATHYMTKRILPMLGDYALNKLTFPVVSDWFDTVSQQAKGGANRALDVLKSVFVLALRLGYCLSDPCHLIKRNPKRRLNRFLSEDELTTLSNVLGVAEEKSPNYYQQANIIRMLLLTGCRVGEILTLRWSMIKPHRLDLPDSKTGARTVYLSQAASDIVARQPHGNGWVFPAPKGQPYHNVTDFWFKVRAQANLTDVRIHDLRHTFASHAALQGNSVPIISAMLGHSRLTMTLRYTHVSQQDVQFTAERVGAVYESILHTGQSVSPPIITVRKQKPASLAFKSLTVRLTGQELAHITAVAAPCCPELWLIEQLKVGVIHDNALGDRERGYRVRAKFERYRQKGCDRSLVLMLSTNEYQHFSQAAKRCQLRLSAWSRVKALDGRYGM